jgi:lipopolysaccharide export system protein LptC
MRLILRDEDGAEALVLAQEGTIDTDSRTVLLEGAVRIETGTGYDVRSDRLEGALDRLDLVSPGPIAGVGPLGEIAAGTMRLTEDAAGRQRLVFTGGVDLLYLPPNP